MVHTTPSNYTRINEITNAAQEPQIMDRISCSRCIYDFLHKVYDPFSVSSQESFWLIVLNQRNDVIGIKEIARGAVASVTLDFKILFTYFLSVKSATSIIVSHNHPSGQTKPSEADRKMTKKLKDACTLLEVKLLDHIIYTPDGYYSFMDMEEVL